MFDIFVSYRSADARFGAAATYELLAHRFGKERIFLDNQSMGPGSDYPRRLREALEVVRVLLVLIGPGWLASDPKSPGRLLLHRDGDWVHREIRRAFERNIPVVPVLLDGTPLPAADLLPDDIARLAQRQTVEVAHRRLGSDVGKLADAIDELLATPPVAPGERRWRRMHEVDDPVSLGVHPSPVRTPPGTGLLADLSLESLRVPAYVARDVADQLAWALGATPFVLLVGDATAGKSRLAYEVARRSLPDHWLVVPDFPADVPAALEWAHKAGNCLVWLDDLERYLSPDSLTAHLVSALAGRAAAMPGYADRVVLLGTIRSQEHTRLSPRWERGADGPDRPRSRVGRDVVRLAYEVYLSRRWSAAEIGRAAVSPDSRVTEAARRAAEFGVAEYLAAGPQLLAEWRDAWSPGVHPRAAALVAAAVDAYRAGVRRGISVGLLRRLHGCYLAARGGSALRPEPFEEALGWATETLHATSSLLVPAGRGRYQPFGYLVDAAEAEQSDIQDDVWQALITRMPATDCWHIGEAAYARRQLAYARSAFERAAAAGNTAAELKTADCIGESGQRAEAIAVLKVIIRVRTRSLGPRHPAVLEAHQALAGWLGRAGDPHAAADLLTDLVPDLAAAVGPTHADTLTARHALANWLGRSGRLPEAVAAYRGLVQDRTRHNGPDQPDTLAARHELANWLGRTGRLEEALAEHEDITAARTRVLGPDHPDTLRSRHRLARLLCQMRGTEVGLPRLTLLVADRVRVLGPDHPDTLRSRAQYVRWTGKAGRFADAVELAEQLATDSMRVLGAEHPDTLRARHQHARWISKTGDHRTAATLLGELIDDWSRILGPHHPYTLISRYRLTLAVAGTGARAEAISLLTDLLAANVVTLGEQHPYTRHARALLSQWAGDPN